MGHIQQMIVLANSYKEGGLCVAGKNLVTRKWIRPVNDSHGGSLPKSTYGNIKLLNIITQNLTQHVPLIEQPENFLVSHSTVNISGNCPRSELNNLTDHPKDLWMYGSKLDRVTPQEIYLNQSNHQSLYLINIKALKIIVEGNYCGNSKLVGEFYYNGVQYKFSITDPEYCKYKNNPIGFTKIETNKYLCLSLSAFFEATGHHYKLIAAIL